MNFTSYLRKKAPITIVYLIFYISLGYYSHLVKVVQADRTVNCQFEYHQPVEDNHYEIEKRETL